MPPGQVIQAQEDFSAGFFTGIAGYLIPENGAARIENGLLDEEGLIYRRGGATYHSADAFGTTGHTFLWDGFLGPGRRTFFASAENFGVLDSDDESPLNLAGDGLPAPVQSAVLDDLLFIGGGYIYGGSRQDANFSGTLTFTNGDATVTIASGFTGNVDEGMLLQRGNERVYRVASVTSDTSLELEDVYEGVNGAATGTFYAVYEITDDDPYPASDFYAVVANRLLAASNDRVSFSVIDNPHSYLVNDFHEVPLGERITGFGVIQQDVILFTTAGAWSLSGLAFNIVAANGDPQHRLALLSRDLILWHPAGITTWEGVLIVPCVDSVWLMSAQGQPARISRPIDATYRRFVRLGYQPGQAVVSRAHLFLPILSGGGAPQGCFACRLDREQLPWTTLSGQGAGVAAFALRVGEGSAAREPKLLGAECGDTSRILDCTTFFYPGVAVKNDPDGTTPVLIVETRTFPTGSGTRNVVRHLRTRYDLVDAAIDNPEVDVSWAPDTVSLDNPKWDEVTWDNFQWGSTEATFIELDCVLPEGQGVVHRCRVGERERYVRFRYRCADPVASLSIKGVEVFVRPSRAVRV